MVLQYGELLVHKSRDWQARGVGNEIREDGATVSHEPIDNLRDGGL